MILFGLRSLKSCVLGPSGVGSHPTPRFLLSNACSMSLKPKRITGGHLKRGKGGWVGGGLVGEPMTCTWIFSGLANLLKITVLIANNLRKLA